MHQNCIIIFLIFSQNLCVNPYENIIFRVNAAIYTEAYYFSLILKFQITFYIFTNVC